jgi:hypothetical protein
MTDLERALADIAEVRDRLGHMQRFRGYSGIAAMASGIFAIVAGIVQLLLVPRVANAHDGHLYFALWFACCAASMIVNYGAIAHWYVNDASARERWQTASVGLSILPAIVVGAALSFAMLQAGLVAFLPGIWCACYGTGLFASRTTLPSTAVWISAAFMAAGIALLFAPAPLALSWWVLAAAFGAGQLSIGASIARL